METEGRAEGSSAEAGGSRKIIHIDMDAFYASVEQRDNPELRGKPVAVGGSRERGVVAAASYEARQFGVHSAMPSITAKRKCPDLIFVKPRFDAYRAISLQIREIFAAYTPIIEPLSLDEAYLDVTENLKRIVSATQIAEEIRARIRAETDLTASAGVSYNKFLAKLASDHRKPDGLFVITPKMGLEFVETLPVRKFHGVGPATAAKMERLGIKTGLDLRAQTLVFLQQHFGKAGSYYYWVAKLHAMRFERSSTRFGDIARAPVLAAAQSRSRSNSLISGRSRGAAPVRCRSEREVNSNSLATPFSSLSSPSRKGFGFWVSPCLRSRWRKLNASPN
jgi:DNA polymerase-4